MTASFSSNTAGAVDYYLKVEGVKGESKDAEKKEWIQVQGWRWLQENAARLGVGNGGGGGKVDPKEFQFLMLASKASPVLSELCSSGKHIDKIQLECRKSGDGQKKYMLITFSDCLISSYSFAGNMVPVKGEALIDAVLPTEIVGMRFSKYQIEYFEQALDGKMGAPVTGGWDFVGNKKYPA
ncbi:Hcp family type VI secretion system effector [Pantoea sp. y20]